MDAHPRSLAAGFEFGPFSVDSTAGELRKSGIRVRLSGQPLRILLILLARPGEVVTREELRRKIWDDQTFVDFEGGLNAAIAKLRRALDDSAEHPRFIETIPGFGYRFVGRVTNLHPPVGTAPTKESPEPPALPPKRRLPLRWPVGIVALALVGSLIAWQWPKSVAAPSMLLRLTNDPGFSGTPAISLDGKLLAYSSDRDRDEGLDLFVKQVSGSEPVRLTFDGQDNITPDFSPDGSTIVFRSSRNGGGIYEVASLGGEPRLIATGGRNPRYSPDGSQIAYWIGSDGIALAVPGSSQVRVISRSGGQPKLVAPELSSARYPIWSPDGKNLLFLGYSSKIAYDGSAIDWWLASVDGTRVTRTGAYQHFVQAGLLAPDFATDRSSRTGTPNLPPPKCWLAGSNTVVFFASKGDTNNLWETGFSDVLGRPIGELKRLTTSSGNEADLSCASSTIVFSNLEEWREIWSIPFDPNSARTQGSLEEITDGPAMQQGPSLSEDERHVAFSSSRSGRLNIWLKDLATGKESQVTRSELSHRYAELSPSGTKIAYSALEPNGGRSIFVTTPGGVPEKLCENCFHTTNWSRDEKAILIFVGIPFRIQLLDISTHRQTPIVGHPDYYLLYAHFSPDSRWISFTERISPIRGRIVLAPMDRQLPVPEGAWIRVAEVSPEDWASWSPDGKILYFTSARDGHLCVWAQRVDPESRHPVGQAFAVLHLHGRLSYLADGWTLGKQHLMMVLRHKTGNIWTIPRPMK